MINNPTIEKYSKETDRYDLFNHLGSYRNIIQFQISSRKENKQITESSRLEFLEKFSGNNFALPNAEDNTSGSLDRGGIAGLPLLRTLLAICQKSREPGFWDVMGSCFISICKFDSFRTLLQQLIAYLNFTSDSEDLSCLYKWTKWFLWTMTAAQAAENHGDEWGWTWYLQWGIHTSVPTWTHLQNSLAAVEALCFKISSYGISLKWL